MNKHFSSLLSILFPPRCVLCNKVIAKEDFGICKHCTKEIHPVHNRWLIFPNTQCLYPFTYAGTIKKAIYAYKFKGRKEVAHHFANWIYEAFDTDEFDYDLVVCVPMSMDKLVQRGYNQTGVIAKLLAKKMHVTYSRRCLAKAKDNRTQHRLSRSERFENIKGVFCVNEDVSHKKVLLIDDITTTGATLMECTQMLLESGCKRVDSAVIAYTLPQERNEEE